VLEIDEEDVRRQMRNRLVDEGAQAFVVCLVNSVVNPAHEKRVEKIILSEYPTHLLGAIPIILSHQVAGRKGEYVRAMSAIIDGYLHSTRCITRCRRWSRTCARTSMRSRCW
jgi:N-methylhydantoinase A